MSDFKLNRAEVAKMQQEADEAARAVIRDVNTRMSGWNPDAVHNELIIRLSEQGITPNAETLWEYARSISERTLTE